MAAGVVNAFESFPEWDMRLLKVGFQLPAWCGGGPLLNGLGEVVGVLALREGELSLLYPIISLAYVWVTVASYFIFRDTINPLRLTGIVIIMIGVAMLGRGPK